jgi:hypothetical protein
MSLWDRLLYLFSVVTGALSFVAFAIGAFMIVACSPRSLTVKPSRTDRKTGVPAPFRRKNDSSRRRFIAAKALRALASPPER